MNASTQVEDVCNEVDKTIVVLPSLELSYEDDDTDAYDGCTNCTYDDYDGLGAELGFPYSSSSTIRTQPSMEARTHEYVSDMCFKGGVSRDISTREAFRVAGV